MKYGLVLEGGAMRGMFTAGVLDVLMEHGITFDAAVGVSAGAVFGCNIKSEQPGRVIRYNTRFCKDKRYCSLRSLIKTGDLFGADFCYRELPFSLDVFDTETYRKNPMKFYAVCTELETGLPVYAEVSDGGENDMKWFRASASMPAASTPVEIDGKKYLDGGMSDSVPLEFIESLGCEKNVVVLTQPSGFVKKRVSFPPVFKIALRKYPNAYRVMMNRHNVYNAQTAYVAEKENAGTAFVIRPPYPLEVGRTEHDAEKLKAAYNTGREITEQRLSALAEFLK